MKGRNFYNLKRRRRKEGNVKSLGGVHVGFQQQSLGQPLSQSNQFCSALGKCKLAKSESAASGAGIHQGKSLAIGMDLLPWAHSALPVKGGEKQP